MQQLASSRGCLPCASRTREHAVSRPSTRGRSASSRRLAPARSRRSRLPGACRSRMPGACPALAVLARLLALRLQQLASSRGRLPCAARAREHAVSRPCPTPRPLRELARLLALRFESARARCLTTLSHPRPLLPSRPTAVSASPRTLPGQPFVFVGATLCTWLMGIPTVLYHSIRGRVGIAQVVAHNMSVWND